jgi:purine-nucleoside phosphorylase
MKKNNRTIRMTSGEMALERRLTASLRAIQARVDRKPDIAIILGSGLGYFVESLNDAVKLSTTKIPHYPQSTIVGHAGTLVFGTLAGKEVLAFQGRIHFYESGDWETVFYPILVASRLGVRTLMITNAAGGINPLFSPGDLMLITDQINLTFAKLSPVQEYPLTSVSDLYETTFRRLIKKTAKQLGIRLQSGVYCGLRGPSYETAAEIRWLRSAGCDAVGMSTVNEVQLAVMHGMRVAGISCITNLSTGISGQKLSHAEVTEVADQVRTTFSRLLTGILRNLPASERGPQ